MGEGIEGAECEAREGYGWVWIDEEKNREPKIRDLFSDPGLQPSLAFRFFSDILLLFF
jgi:hypothetical protein